MFDTNRCHKSPGYIYIIRWIKLCFGIISYLFIDLKEFVIKIFKGTKSKNISGQVALVTGGGNGLGREISIQLAKQGCNVVIADIDLKGATETSQILIEQYNVKSSAYRVDITKYNEIESLKTKIENTLGPVDILVNNAGLLPTTSTMTVATPEESERIINVNLISHIWTVKIFLAGMKERQKGHIVAISSLAGLTAAPISNAYSATKFGVRGLMESLTCDLFLLDLEDKIHTTTIYPLFIATNENLIQYLEDNQVLQYIPIMTPSFVGEEVVKAILKNKIEVVIPGSILFHLLLKLILPKNAQNYYTRKICVVKPN